tara:strand:- start:1746 stop:2504 length:759 start_codon:yes stop_codon:yes gene_type:complete
MEDEKIAYCEICGCNVYLEEDNDTSYLENYEGAYDYLCADCYNELESANEHINDARTNKNEVEDYISYVSDEINYAIDTDTVRGDTYIPSEIRDIIGDGYISILSLAGLLRRRVANGRNITHNDKVINDVLSVLSSAFNDHNVYLGNKSLKLIQGNYVSEKVVIVEEELNKISGFQEDEKKSDSIKSDVTTEEQEFDSYLANILIKHKVPKDVIDRAKLKKSFNDKLQAVKIIKDATGENLKTCKQYVEKYL